MEQSSLVASRSLVSTTRRSRFLCSGLLTCRVGATATASINFAQAGAKVFERWSNRLALVPSLIKMKLDSGCTCLLSQATEPTHEPSGSPCAGRNASNL